MGNKKVFTREEKFHLWLTKYLCDNDCGDLNDKTTILNIMNLNIKYINGDEI